MSAQWRSTKPTISKLKMNRRLEVKRDHLNQLSSRRSTNADTNASKRLRARTLLSNSIDLYVSAFGLCFVAIMAGLTTASLIPIAFQLTLTVWIIGEFWFWITSVLRGEDRLKGTQDAIPRTLIALCLWLLCSIIEFDGQLIKVISQLLFVYLWTETVYRGYQEGRIYDPNRQMAKQAEEKLLGGFALLSSSCTLLMWRAHALTTAVDLSAVMMAQAPLIIGVSIHWLSYIRPAHKSISICIISYLKHCGVAFIMSFMTVFASHSDSVFKHSLLILSIAFVMLFYVSYLLPSRALWSSKTRALQSPLRSLSFSFISLCTLGTGLLMLPAVTVDDQGLNFIEAIFTSVSASCITGLSIIDLSKMSFFGQAVVLCLIQIGGFGIVLISHMLFSASVHKQTTKLSKNKQSPYGKLRLTIAQLGYSALATSSSAARLFSYVLAVELVAAISLILCFLNAGLAPLDAIWRGFFTSISAFCNAGFALQSDSFVSYANYPIILSIISLTVFFGGIGPTVIFELVDRRKIKGAKPPLSYFSKLIIWGSIGLFIMPAFLFCALEWNHAFVHLTPFDKCMNALFHSTSLRTAGFNSVDLTQLTDSSWSISLLLMMMGGSPLSTAGGIKVTTMLIALSAISPLLRGRQKSILFNRAHPLTQSSKAVATLLFSLMIVFVVTLTLQASGEALGIKTLLFEVISALGTVGLSMGGTAALSQSGLWLVMFCMFLGRVGPPALLLSFSEGVTTTYEDTYIDEEVPLS